LAVAVAALFAGSASADGDLYFTVYKQKQVYVSISVQKNKDIDIDVDYEQDLDGAAEADINVNQLNENNTVDRSRQLGEQTPFGLELDATIENSVNGNTGIIGVNQDVGANVNQGNVVALALSDSESVVADAEASADQINRFNRARQWECDSTQCPEDFETDATRTALINDSINNNRGIVGVNQNSGSNNNQLNGLANTIGLGTHVALAETDLSQDSYENTISGANTFKTDLINGSVLGNSGIVGVNQTVGNNNNQGAVVSFSALVTPVVLSTPGVELP
jgi:hypothetical protein